MQRAGRYGNKKSLATGQGFSEGRSIYFVVVVVVVVVAAAGLLLSFWDAATATATIATVAATIPAVIPPTAAVVAGTVPATGAAPAPPPPPAPAGVCANALPATRTDAIKTASAFFIFLSCINLGGNRIRK